MRKIISRILVTVSAAAVLLGIMLLGLWYLDREYVYWSGSLFPRDSRELNITGKQITEPEIFLEFPELKKLDARDTGMTAAQYDWCLENLPRCEILWDVPVQGGFLPQDTRELTLENPADADITALQYLPMLSTLEVGRWGNYTRIRELKARYPALEIRYQVQIGQEWWHSDGISLVVADADPEELAQKLDLFPRLESVMFTGTIPSQTALMSLKQQFPDIFFLWKMNVLGMTLETDITQVDLSGVPPESIEEFTQLLPYFPALEQINLGSSLSDARQIASLITRYPNIRFLFELAIGSHTLPSDAVEIDISNTPLESTDQIEALLPCFPNLKKVVMCECGISNEEMDALNRRHENIRFVWSVNLGGILFRTDAIHFTPNRWGLKLTNEDIYPLRYCTDMICVDIGHQLKVTNCDWAAYMPNLKYLILAETSISDLTPLTGLTNLIYLELFLMPARDFTPLTTLTALEDLNLCYTQGNPAPVGELTWLKRLWWTGNWQASVELPQKLKTTYMEFNSPSSTGKGWRDGQNYFDMRDLIGMEYMTG